jgi:hypothetical protein
MKLYLAPVKGKGGRFDVWHRKRDCEVVIGDVEERGPGDWAVLHHASDLSYDGVDTLVDALQLLWDIHDEHKNEARRLRMVYDRKGKKGKKK